MKKNRMMRIAAFLLVAALLSICVVSGTYAKYTSEITGTDTARVAKWDVQVNNVTAGSKDGAVAKTFEFDLFKTIIDTIDASSAETDMDPTDGSIIAPGTQGSFIINLHNASQVTAEYTVEFEVTNTKNIPIEFSVNNGAWGSLADITTAVPLAINGDGEIKVAWRWVFEDGNDANDTALGLDGSATITVAAVVTATQVD
jgi:hypothetical protein